MGVVKDVPQFPVIDKEPPIMDCAIGLRSAEWQFAGMLGAGSTVLGYYIGKPTFLHRPTAALAGSMGLFYGYLYGFQNSTGRLMGFRENGPELEALQASK